MSAVAAVPFFGRAWKITLDTTAGDHLVLSWDQFSEPLRITFVIDTYAMLAYWRADVTLYNVNQRPQSTLASSGISTQSWTLNQPIKSGDVLSISAGYQYNFDAEANLLYRGEVFQPMWTRENVVDWKITLRCLHGLLLDAANFVNFSVASSATQYQVVTQIATQANIPVENVDQQTLSQKQYVRSQAIYGRPFPILWQIAKENNLQAWVSPHGLNMRSLRFDPTAAPDIVYAPVSLSTNLAPSGTQQGKVKRTLLGVPEQTQEGMLFRVLLDPEVRIGNIVQLAPGTAISPLPLQIGQYPSLVDRQNMYVVAGVRHVGDSRGRGEDWYTEITGLSANFFNMLAASQTPIGAQPQ